jgi:hypothetical protein
MQLPIVAEPGQFGAVTPGKILADELAQEFLLIHAVLEGFVAVDEDHGNFVSEAMTQVVVAVNVDLAPNEAASTL